MKPKGVQRKRTRGWKIPPHCKYVGRPGMYGNPFVVGVNGTARECVAKYKRCLVAAMKMQLVPPPIVIELLSTRAHTVVWFYRIAKHLADGDLRGYDLTCWCALDAPCHRNVLLDLANRPRGARRERNYQGAWTK